MSKDNASVRNINMSKRRQRILHEARLLITAGGYDAVTLRHLAAQANVTVPTIYNLIGNKETVVTTLFSEALTEIERRVGNTKYQSPLDFCEAAAIESTGLFAEDENYYRAAFIAIEHLNQQRNQPDSISRIYRAGERIVASGLRSCAEAGLLLGIVDPQILSEQFIRSYRTSCRDWAFGQISIETLRATALVDLNIILATDAVETFRKTVLKRITAIRQNLALK